MKWQMARIIGAGALAVSLVGCCKGPCNKKKDDSSEAVPTKDEDDEGEDGNFDKDKKKGKDDEKEELPNDDNKEPPAEEPTYSNHVLRFPKAHLRVNVPMTWNNRHHIRGWQLFQPSDKLATIGYIAARYSRAKYRLHSFASVVGFRRIRFHHSKFTRTGPDRLFTWYAKGRCYFRSGGNNCQAEYAKVSAGKLEKLLMVYTVTLPTGGRRHLKEAAASWHSVRKIRLYVSRRNRVPLRRQSTRPESACRSRRALLL